MGHIIESSNSNLHTGRINHPGVTLGWKLRRLLPDPINRSLRRSALLRLHPSLNMSRYGAVAQSLLGQGIRLGDQVGIVRSELGDHTSVGLRALVSGARIGRFALLGPRSQVGYTDWAMNPRWDRSGLDHPDRSFTPEHITTVIGNAVHIGDGAVILGGIEIGDGAIIEAGAVVRSDVPAYAVVGGSPSAPAKVLCYRFSPRQINFLLAWRWWDKPIAWLEDRFRTVHGIDHLVAMLLGEHTSLSRRARLKDPAEIRRKTQRSGVAHQPLRQPLPHMVLPMQMAAPTM